ncbi:hypothetical protein C8R44DRAFT_883432 [Mycena epipterygia]|nr:hypothetical protein C8R44DRAFT_883432 [Mycena epipterygia]
MKNTSAKPRPAPLHSVTLLVLIPAILAVRRTLYVPWLFPNASSPTLVAADAMPQADHSAEDKIESVVDTVSYASPTNSYDIPTVPPPMSYVDLTGAGVSTSSIPEALGVPGNEDNGIGVDVGPVGWDEDISSQVHGLIARMPRAKTIDREKRGLYAKQFHNNNWHFTTVYSPAPGYEKVSVSFVSGN